jgi:cellulose synthase/poly-beta-1,6-N-acetylglucosamine synthase-like glycosyltransferase
MKEDFQKASIIIPARKAERTIFNTLRSVLVNPLCESAEIIIVNDGLDNATIRLIGEYPVKMVDGKRKGIAAARNMGIELSKGEILIFLDADCCASKNWLTAHLKAHECNETLLAVGGSICMDPGASFWARCDHYSSWYNVHPYQPKRWVPNHPGANLSISRQAWEQVGEFREDLPHAGVHEDFEWQKRFERTGGKILFEPRAAVWHVDRSDFKSYLAHHCQWGYNSIEVKSKSRISRFPWIYRNPLALIIGFIPFAVAHTIYTMACWLKEGKLEPLFFCAFIFFGRLSYSWWMAVGGIRYLTNGKKPYR